MARLMLREARCGLHLSILAATVCVAAKQAGVHVFRWEGHTKLSNWTAELASLFRHRNFGTHSYPARRQPANVRHSPPGRKRINHDLRCRDGVRLVLVAFAGTSQLNSGEVFPVEVVSASELLWRMDGVAGACSCSRAVLGTASAQAVQGGKGRAGA